MKDIDGWGCLGYFIGFILSVVFLIAIIAFFKSTDEKISIKNWNNGVCPIDGTHWVYNNSSVSNGWTTNFYRCENGHITKTYDNFTPNN